MINPVQLACLYHLFWYHFWPALMSFLMVLESRFWGGALFSATAGLPTQWAHSCWWLSNIKGRTLGKLQQKHVFKSDNRNNLALTTTHLSLCAGYTDPPAPRKDLEQKNEESKKCLKILMKGMKAASKKCPHKIWFAACDTKIQASHKSCHSLIYKLPSGISSHFLPIAKSRYCISQTHIGRDSCITSLGMWIVGVRRGSVDPTRRCLQGLLFLKSSTYKVNYLARLWSTINGFPAKHLTFMKLIWTADGFSSGITRQLQRTRLMKRWIKRNTKRSWRNTWRNTPSATFLSLRENPFR